MKRLYKSRKNKVIDGVCGGIAEYIGVDPVLVRLVTALLLIFSGGVIFIGYILAMIIMPTQPYEGGSDEEVTQPESSPSSKQSSNFGAAGSLIFGAILILLGGHFLMGNIPFFNHYYRWFWDMGWHFIWPSILIAVGLLVILQARRRQ